MGNANSLAEVARYISILSYLSDWITSTWQPCIASPHACLLTFCSSVLTYIPSPPPKKKKKKNPNVHDALSQNECITLSLNCNLFLCHSDAFLKKSQGLETLFCGNISNTKAKLNVRVHSLHLSRAKQTLNHNTFLSHPYSLGALTMKKLH